MRSAMQRRIDAVTAEIHDALAWGLVRHRHRCRCKRFVTEPQCHRSRWSDVPNSASVTSHRFAVGALVAATAISGCSSDRSATPDGPSSTATSTSPSPTRSLGACPITAVSGSATPPSSLGYRTPPPVPYVRDWYGNDSLWVMLPPMGKLPSSRDPDGRLGTKFPWFRLASGEVQVTAERLDGPTASFVADVGTVSEYGDRGFTPSMLYWSAPGCWRVTGRLAARELMFVVLVAAPEG